MINWKKITAYTLSTYQKKKANYFSGSRRTEKPGVLQSMGLQRVEQDLDSEKQQDNIIHSSQNISYTMYNIQCKITKQSKMTKNQEKNNK